MEYFINQAKCNLSVFTLVKIKSLIFSVTGTRTHFSSQFDSQLLTYSEN